MARWLSDCESWPGSQNGVEEGSLPDMTLLVSMALTQICGSPALASGS